MNLSRRDALAALAATGVVAGGSVALADDGTDGNVDPADGVPENVIGDDTVAILAAVGSVVYPDATTGIDPFVETYVSGRLSDDPDHRRGVVDAAAELDATARDWFDAPVTELDRSTCDRLLRELGVDAVDPDPEGSLSGRVRFYIVNELLYAFYSSPTGGRLVGIENPVGYPGGTESYRRASMGEETEHGRE
ncbi:gluconate 2-dehydrogenase subunit 3 family protein [Haloplanus sp.]|uniref:gluconate 2-dehydrogenase subunit 3 family protein n=1 Tax=Haloplanus sp. TaxID=1961696 RepID=UPI00262E3EC5|nr:gluconate 2-dehydrogenase subunit 3 family protein [Haloplanus sp.]